MLKPIWQKQLSSFLNNKSSEMNRSIYIATVLCFVTIISYAQRPPSISSPEVHNDNTITFKYYSRTAQKVSLSGEFLSASQTMTKDTSGVWSITVGPVK